MSVENNSYLFFYQYVWYLPIQFDSDRLEKEAAQNVVYIQKADGKRWMALGKPTKANGSSTDFLTIAHGHFEQMPALDGTCPGKQLEDPPDMLSFAFSPTAIDHTDTPNSDTVPYRIHQAGFRLLDSGLASVQFLLEARDGFPGSDRIAAMDRAAEELNEWLIPAVLSTVAQLCSARWAKKLHTVPWDLFEEQGTITAGMRYDCFLFVLGEDDAAFERILKEQSLDVQPFSIADFDVHLGWYLNAVRVPARIRSREAFLGDAEGVPDIIQADLLQLGAFTAASATADALRDVSRNILDGALKLKKPAVRSLIMQGRQVIGYCHALKGVLSNPGSILFEKLNEKGGIAREALHFEDAAVNILRGLEGIEQDRSEKADRAIQLLLLFLTSVTLVSVVKDAIDFLASSIWPSGVFWKETTYTLSGVLLVICITLIYAGRKIFRR